MKSIMFRNNKDTVHQMFNQNKIDKGDEFELYSDPNQLKNVGQQTNPNVAYGGMAVADRNKKRILERYTHEKRIMFFLIQTSVRLRNLSKDRLNLASASDGLMLCGILLLKKVMLLNFYTLDSLKRNYNIYGLEDFDSFLTLQDRAIILDELENTDIPNYHKLFNHLLTKIKSEMGYSNPRTQEVLRVVEDSNQTIIDRKSVV